MDPLWNFDGDSRMIGYNFREWLGRGEDVQDFHPRDPKSPAFEMCFALLKAGAG